ncbi:MAG: hypothetical protein LBU89_11710 [Fibromonadaceae bacterium]|nr:hypothetical protein [Fibromonadaceae bacterium]
MSNMNNARPIYWSNYPNNSGVQLVHPSTYPNNPGVMLVGETTNYPDNPGVLKAHRSDYPNNSGVRLIYMTGCFPKSELVHTHSEAYSPIGSLKIGDKISSWDVGRKKLQYTAVTGIHKYTVNDIMYFNNTMLVSATHPLMVAESSEGDLYVPKWKVAFDVKIGDRLIGTAGKLIEVKTKSRHWYDFGIEVLNLSTDCGAPFLVGGFVVRAENAKDNIELADAPLTQKIVA